MKTENRLPLLDLLIKASEDGKVLSNQDIRQEIDTFMFEVLNAFSFPRYMDPVLKKKQLMVNVT